MNNTDRKIFGVLFFALFNALLGAGIVIPILPVYAHSLGASGLYISMIFGSFSLSRTFLLPYFGNTSDKKGRKPFIITGLFGFAVVSIAFIYFDGITSLIVIRFFQGIASAMVMPVAQAYIGDITPKGKEGYYMGLFNMSLFISLSIGPLAGGFINEYFSLQVAFICMGILALIGFFIGLFFLPPTSQEKCITSQTGEPPKWYLLLKNRKIMGLFAFRLAFSISIAVIWCFIPVFADAEFHLSSSLIGILVTSGVFISGILNTPMGFVADRISKNGMIIAGGLLVSLSLFSLIWSTGFWSMLLSISIFGLGGGISMPPLMALAVIYGNEEKALGTVMSILTLAQSLGMLAGSVIAGLAMDYFNLRYSFPLAALIAFMGIVSFVKSEKGSGLTIGCFEKHPIVKPDPKF